HPPQLRAVVSPEGGERSWFTTRFVGAPPSPLARRQCAPARSPGIRPYVPESRPRAGPAADLAVGQPGGRRNAHAAPRVVMPVHGGRRYSFRPGWVVVRWSRCPEV